MSQSKKIFQDKLISFLLILILPLLFINCSGSGPENQDQLIGKWNRTDGDYTLDITEAGPEGLLKVAYLNPNPIHVGRSAWRIHENALQLYVELQDENYPGSLYTLYYDEASGMLLGTYFQAVAKQTFEVQFSRVP